MRGDKTSRAQVLKKTGDYIDLEAVQEARKSMNKGRGHRERVCAAKLLEDMVDEDCE